MLTIRMGYFYTINMIIIMNASYTKLNIYKLNNIFIKYHSIMIKTKNEKIIY